jgi:sugar lactone lactonase YvrE
MCTDSLSNIWVAFYGCGQVRNYSPEGELLNIVQAPTALTTCASFGGKDLKTLFITSVKDYRSPEFAFDPKNDPYGGMCFEVELPISGKLDFAFNA